MELNKTQKYDDTDNPTECCTRFNTEGWDDLELHFKDKMFVKVTTRSLCHIPINRRRVFAKTSKAIERADADDMEQFVVLSRDISPWKSEHYFAVTKEIPGEEVVQITGDFLTQIFEGPYKEARLWYQEMRKKIGAVGKRTEEIYFFYTTCPKCAKIYGNNFVVGFGKMV